MTRPDRGELCGHVGAAKSVKWAGVDVPLHATEHFYMQSSEPMDDLPSRTCRFCATWIQTPISRRTRASFCSEALKR